MANPSLGSVTPSSGPVGTEVELYGFNGGTPGVVQIDGLSAQVLSWSSQMETHGTPPFSVQIEVTRIRALIPSGAAGSAAVRYKKNGNSNWSNSVNFTVS